MVASTLSASYFNPLPPCGGRPGNRTHQKRHTKFQSTPSVWRETGMVGNQGGIPWHFNPLPPCGGRRREMGREHPPPISIHSLRVEGDGDHPGGHAGGDISIHSLRVEGDCPLYLILRCAQISIHSLRVEGDAAVVASTLSASYFNPLPPCGGRLLA